MTRKKRHFAHRREIRFFRAIVLTSVLSQTEGGDSIHRIFKRLHYLRYYLVEATSHVKEEHCSEFATYYKKNTLK